MFASVRDAREVQARQTLSMAMHLQASQRIDIQVVMVVVRNQHDCDNRKWFRCNGGIVFTDKLCVG